jgi:TonB family protein
MNRKPRRTEFPKGKHPGKGVATSYRPPRATGALFSMGVAIGASVLLFGLLEVLQRGAVRPGKTPGYVLTDVHLLKPLPRAPRTPESPRRKRRKRPKRKKPLRVLRKNLRAERSRPRVIPMKRLLLSADLRRFAPLTAADIVVTVPRDASFEDTTGPAEPSAELRSYYHLDEVDEPPRRAGYVRPTYPEAARRMGLEGWAEVEFIVGEAGRVRDAVIRGSRGGRGFERAALKAVRRWMFRPARKGGRAVPVLCLVKIRFALED